MNFCENDDNMLYIKIDDEDETLKYYCKLCLSEYSLEDLNKGSKCVYKQNYNTNDYSFRTYVNDNIYDDPTLPRINNLKCINEKCDTNTKGTPKEVIYIKYDRLGMKFLYCCAVCKHKWTSSNVKEE